MKLIDKQGKLFGKINLIDFIALLFVMFLVLVLFFGYNIFTKRTAGRTVVEAPKVFTDEVVNFNLIGLKPELVKNFAVGDKVADEDNNVVGEISWMGESVPHEINFDLGGDNIEREDDTLRDLHVMFKLKVEERKEKLYLDNVRVKLYNSFQFKIKNYDIFNSFL